MSITIRDVAKRLNLSITTVSRALDGYDDVAEETRQLVIRTANEMGYSPNRAARMLRRKKSETIGFILPASAQRIAEPFFMEFLAGLGDELAVQGYDLLVANAITPASERELYQRWVSSLKVDGLVVNRVYVDDWRIQFLNEHTMPFATLERSNESAGNPSIEVDGADCYLELVNHLYENGFRRLAFLGGPAQLVNNVNQLDWVRQAVRSVGLDLDPACIVSTEMTSAQGYQATKDLLALPDPPDAVLCINDEMAFGALHAAHEQGLSIGREIGIAGFDGMVESQHTEPPLTTLNIPVYGIACQLVQMVLKTLSGETLAHTHAKIKPELLIRESTNGQS